MNAESHNPEKLRVIIAGGGVAALETALALADLAPEHTDVTVIAPNTEFVYRPMAVREPFAYGPARRYPLAPIVDGTPAQSCSAASWAGSTRPRRRSTPRTIRRSSTTRWCWRSGRGSSRATSTR